MSGKVTITVEQAEAIEANRDMGKSHLIGHILGLKYKTYDENSCTTPELSDLSRMDINTFLDALYIGYEVEKTPEEKVREHYKDLRRYSKGTIYAREADIIEKTLNLLGITIEGVNA